MVLAIFQTCQNGPVSQRLLARPKPGASLSPIPFSRIDQYINSGQLIWLDVVTEDMAELDLLGRRFGFHPAAIEDIVDIEQLPKADYYDDYLFVVLHALTTEIDDDNDEGVDTLEVDCFVRNHLFVTVRATEVPGIDWLWESVQKYAHLSANGADDLFAQLSEVIGRRYLEVIDTIEARIDDLADAALEAQPQVLAEVQTLRREDATIRKVLRPQRLVISNLRHQDHPVISASARQTLLDSYDVHNQVVESLASARGLLTDTLDTYRGAAAERHANAATLLTVYSAILLPLTLITGWYGMNVRNLPGAESPVGWEVVTFVMIAIAVGSWFWFVRIGLVRLPALRRRPRAVRGLAAAAKAPVRSYTMLRGTEANGSRSSGPTSDFTDREESVSDSDRANGGQ